jgi:hypothetical protein
MVIGIALIESGAAIELHGKNWRLAPFLLLEMEALDPANADQRGCLQTTKQRLLHCGTRESLE